MSAYQRISAASGEWVMVLSRDDLLTNHQLFLERHHRRVQLFCGCKGDLAAPRPAVDVRAISGGRFTLVRECVREHAVHCVLRRANEDVDPLSRRAAGVLGLDAAGSTRSGDASSHAGGSAHYETFNEYAQGALSLGLAKAVVACSRRCGRMCMPTALEALAGVAGAVLDMQFADGVDGFESAERHGGKLRVGMLFADADHVMRELGCHAPVYWWDAGRLALGMLGGDPGAWGSAASRISRFGSIQRGPYFALAVLGARGALVRLYLHQVYATERTLVPTESALEQTVAAHFATQGATFIKPVRMSDADWALGQLGYLTPGFDQWHGYRPDFIRLGSGSIFVVEVRGFRAGEFPGYDARLGRVFKPCE